MTSILLFVHSDDVNEGVQSLFLTWIGDLWDWRQTEPNFLPVLVLVTGVADAPIVAITNCKDSSARPDVTTHLLPVDKFALGLGLDLII